jgi:hypothetical protein
MQLLFLCGFLCLLISLVDHGALAFAPLLSESRHNNPEQHRRRQRQEIIKLEALGDFTVELEKPLGIILEERGVNTGVRVKEIRPEGSAASSRIVPGDVLVQVGDENVETLDFDSIMELIVSSPRQVRLTVGDGLGVLDMPRNVVNLLKSKEDAYFIDAVVREAVREIRRNGRLGDLIKVEVIVGAGVQNDGTRGLVRFFAIFSTDGVSTYSCNVASTGIRQADGTIKIVSLSCAKDEGLGQTFDLIKESENTKS